MKSTVIVVVVIMLIGIVYFLSKGSSVSTPIVQTPTSQTQGIQNDNELTSASADLDNTNLNTVDSELNQSNQDASSL